MRTGDDNRPQGGSVSRAGATRSAFATVTALFFGWGLITSLVDPLVAAVKNIFSLTNTQAQLSAFAFFIAYGVVSIPAAALTGRLSAVRGIMLALGLMIFGCLIIMTATDVATYTGVLAGLFVLASGITVLQVAANPLAAALGPPERSHFRLTLAQAFNSLGTVLGPLIGARLFLGSLGALRGVSIDGASSRAALASINGAFLSLTALILVLTLFIWTMRRRLQKAAPAPAPGLSVGAPLSSVMRSRWALLGSAALFLYVGAEVSIGTQLALFLHDRTVWNIPLQRAGYFVSLYWLGAMLGRFAGSGLTIVLPAARLLSIATAIAALLCVAVVLIGGAVGGYAALAVGLCNAIMFPTIFTLTLERSSASPEATSGVLCTAIVGGAFLPLLAGAVADALGYERSFIVPATCYLLLCGFAIRAGRVRPRSDTPPGDLQSMTE